MNSKPVSVSKIFLAPLLACCIALQFQTANARGKDDSDGEINKDYGGEVDLHYVPGAKWKEQQADIPPFPKDNDLIQFQVDSAGAPYTYYLDKATLKVGTDNVVRYVVVLESDSGARNIMYEGIRCDSSEYKTYAYGTRKGDFVEARSTEWKPVTTEGAMGYRGQLHFYYVCDKQLTLKTDDIIQRIKYAGDSTNPGIFNY